MRKKIQGKKSDYCQWHWIRFGQICGSRPEGKKRMCGKCLKLKEDDIFVVSVAQRIKRKNHIVLIRVVAELKILSFICLRRGNTGSRIKS